MVEGAGGWVGGEQAGGKVRAGKQRGKSRLRPLQHNFTEIRRGVEAVEKDVNAEFEKMLRYYEAEQEEQVPAARELDMREQRCGEMDDGGAADKSDGWLVFLKGSTPEVKHVVMDLLGNESVGTEHLELSDVER